MEIFPLNYAGNIAFYQQLLNAENPVFEVKENFIKQTHRTRMEILGPNGIHRLSIPTRKTNARRVMDEVQISYTENWQKDHWKGLEAAYRRSPYFEYYEHHFKPFYTEETELLVDFNHNFHQKICSLLKIECSPAFTSEYNASEHYSNDFRTNEIELLKEISYMQVFGDRHPFTPNMSVLDALFNLGPRTAETLF